MSVPGPPITVGEEGAVRLRAWSDRQSRNWAGAGEAQEGSEHWASSISGRKKPYFEGRNNRVQGQEEN